MSSLHKIDQYTEYKLTNAILKAASISMASLTDPSLVLALQLDKAGLPNKFNKVATQAFNRRLSVIELGSRTDLTKADTFKLADNGAVDKARGVLTLLKAASYNDAPFMVNFTRPSALKKTASVVKARPVDYVLDIPILKFMRKILAALDADTNTMMLKHYEILKEQLSLDKVHKQACAELKKNLKISRQLATVYGSAYTNLFSDLPEECLKKSAKYAVLKPCMAVELALRAIKLRDSVLLKKAEYRDMQLQTKFNIKIASMILKHVNEGMMSGLIKQGAGGWSVGKALIANTLSGATNTLTGTGEAAWNRYMLDLDKYRQLAYSDKSVLPVEALTAQLLAQDKQDDQRAALAEVLADPHTKDFPYREVEDALRDATNEQSIFLSPRYQEHMKANVAQKLLQGGLSLAGMYATQAFAEQASKAKKSENEEKAEYKVSELGPEKTKMSPEDLKLTELFKVKMPSLKGSKTTTGEELEKWIDQMDKDHLKEKKDLLKEIDTAIKEREKRIKDVKEDFTRSLIARLIREQAKNPTLRDANGRPLVNHRLSQALQNRINTMDDKALLNYAKHTQLYGGKNLYAEMSAAAYKMYVLPTIEKAIQGGDDKALNEIRTKGETYAAI